MRILMGWFLADLFVTLMDELKLKNGKKTGRRAKPLRELKSERTTVWGTHDQMADIDARRGHYSRSEWLLLCGLQQDPAPPPTVVPEVNLVAWSDLKQGPMSTLHQIMYSANQAEVIEPGNGMKVLAERCQEAINAAHQLRDGLLAVHVLDLD